MQKRSIFFLANVMSSLHASSSINLGLTGGIGSGWVEARSAKFTTNLQIFSSSDLVRLMVHVLFLL